MAKNGVLILRTDGGSRGNPGPAAAGIVIEREDGSIVAQGKKYLGELTNNQAEYLALLYGLEALKHYEPSAVRVYMDSELVVRQMQGRYQVRNELLLPLFERAQALARELPDVTFTHVLREQNTLADMLANEAMDEARDAARRAGAADR